MATRYVLSCEKQAITHAAAGAQAMAQVLLAEDDNKQAHVISLYLQRDGHDVTTVHDGQSAIDACRQGPPDLFILDVRLPKVNGLDVCRVLREESSVAIIMLTANRTEEDLLAGLTVGADDYITKPFSPRELIARVRTVLRRVDKTLTRRQKTITVGGLEIDTASFEVLVDGRPVTLTGKEFEVLKLLASSPGHIFSRQEIMQRALQSDHQILERTIDAHVMNLRRKIEPDIGQPRYLQTIYGRGYRLTPPP